MILIAFTVSKRPKMIAMIKEEIEATVNAVAEAS